MEVPQHLEVLTIHGAKCSEQWPFPGLYICQQKPYQLRQSIRTHMPGKLFGELARQQRF